MIFLQALIPAYFWNNFLSPEFLPAQHLSVKKPPRKFDSLKYVLFVILVRIEDEYGNGWNKNLFEDWFGDVWHK